MSHVATYRDKRQVVPMPYAPGGCPVKLDGEKCGETQGLDIIKDFHQLYEEKMSEIDVSAGGDSLQEKVDLQQKWINDLTEQNKMLAKVIEELETEAIGRLQQLENQLKNAAKSFGEEDQEGLADKDRKIRELEEALKGQPIAVNDSNDKRDNRKESDREEGENREVLVGKSDEYEELDKALEELTTGISRNPNESKDRQEQQNKDRPGGKDRENDEPEFSSKESPSMADGSKDTKSNGRQEQDTEKQQVGSGGISEEFEFISNDFTTTTDISKDNKEPFDGKERKSKEFTSTEMPPSSEDSKGRDKEKDRSKEDNKEPFDGKERKSKEFATREMPPSSEDSNGRDKEKGRSKEGGTEESADENRTKGENEKESSGLVNRIDDSNRNNEENDVLKQVDIITSASDSQKHEDSSLPLCPIRKDRPCWPETCRKGSRKPTEPISSMKKYSLDITPNQVELSSPPDDERNEKTIPPICPVLKDRPCSPENCKKTAVESTEPVKSELRSNSATVYTVKQDHSSRSKLGGENLEKKSVHLLIEANEENVIVEPEKDHDQQSLDICKPRIDSIPVIGTQDSLEFLKAKSNSERSLVEESPQNNSCECENKNFVDEFMNMKEENKMLREGEEIKQLRNELDEKMKRILELNEENRTLNDMVNALKSNQALILRYSEEIDHLKKSLKWTSKEKEEYEYLKQKVKLLEQGKGDTENITTNLQTAVDLYVDTIQLLESSEQKLKYEVEQYRVNNDVMGESLVNLGQEIEDLNQKFHQDIEEQIWLNFMLHIESIDIQHTNNIREKQIIEARKLHQQLMDLNYDLEMEHVNTLQDLSMLEAQLYKYQSFLKIHQEDKSTMKVQLKKLSKKNKCYEEIVQFFKEEMSVMSDELLTLQEVLNVTNVSSQEENTRLINAILQLRRINDRLVSHLCEIEKQVVLENQINQINEARINELQNIIGSKNNDLNQHDQTIQEMRRKLCNATKQNTDLKKTIKNLTDAVVEIQEGIKSVERDHNRNKNDVSLVESKVCLANGNLQDIKVCIEQKNDKILELENQLKTQEVSIILATKELEVIKEKKADYKKVIISLKDQLASYEKKNEEMMGDYQLVSNQLQDYTNLDHMKNYELNHYKGLVEEMKMSLMQMNYGLEKCEASNIHFYEDMKNSDTPSGENDNESGVFKDLRKSMADMKRRLSDAEFKGGLIEEELLKVKESHMTQIREEVTESQKELETKILASIEEQAKLNLLVEQQKEEIEELKKELQKEKLESCSYKRSVSELKNEKMASNAHLEILHLKCELNKSLQRQRLLVEENDKIHSKMISLRKKLSTIEQAYEVMKQENEEYKIQLKKTLREKEYISHKNQELTKNIEEMRSSHDHLERQCRYTSDCVQNLELELSETQTERDNISSEAQNLAEVVKMWLKEQNIVNGEIRGKFQNYSDIIGSMRESMMKRMSQEKSWIKKPMQQPFSPRRYTSSPQSDRRSSSPTRNRRSERQTSDVRYRSVSPWRSSSGYPQVDLLEEEDHSHKSNLLRNISYDSNPSPFTSRSPSPQSDYLQGEVEMNNMNLNDWFSPNFKETDTDADEGDDDLFINKLHVLTAQVQEANKRWQQKMNPNAVSTSRAKNSNV